MSDTPRRKSSRNRVPSLRLRESQESEQLQQSQQSHQSRPRGRGRGGRGGRGGLVSAGSEPDEAGEEEDEDQEGSQESADEGDAAVAAELTAVRGRRSYSAQLWRNTTDTAAANRTDGFSTATSSPTSPPAPLSPGPATRGSAAAPDGPATAPGTWSSPCHRAPQTAQQQQPRSRPWPFHWR